MGYHLGSGVGSTFTDLLHFITGGNSGGWSDPMQRDCELVSIETLRERCEEETGLVTPAQPVWHHNNQMEAAE